MDVTGMSKHTGTGTEAADAIAAIASVFQAHHKERHFSGAGLVKRGYEVLFSGAHGYAHRGWRIPNTVSTRFDTASITKLFTAVAVLQLVERGLLSLHDGVLDILRYADSKGHVHAERRGEPWRRWCSQMLP